MVLNKKTMKVRLEERDNTELVFIDNPDRELVNFFIWINNNTRFQDLLWMNGFIYDKEGIFWACRKEVIIRAYVFRDDFRSLFKEGIYFINKVSKDQIELVKGVDVEPANYRVIWDTPFSLSHHAIIAIAPELLTRITKPFNLCLISTPSERAPVRLLLRNADGFPAGEYGAIVMPFAVNGNISYWYSNVFANIIKPTEETEEAQETQE